MNNKEKSNPYQSAEYVVHAPSTKKSEVRAGVTRGGADLRGGKKNDRGN